MEEVKIFTDLMGSLIAKYADKIDLDGLPDVPKYFEKINDKKENMNCLVDSLAN